MEICRDMHIEIDHVLIDGNSLGGISIAEVLMDLEPEPDWPKNIEYFQRTKWGLETKVILVFRHGGILLSFILLNPRFASEIKNKTAKFLPTLVPMLLYTMSSFYPTNFL